MHGETPFADSAPIHPAFRTCLLPPARELPIEHHHIAKHMAQLRRAGVRRRSKNYGRKEVAELRWKSPYRPIGQYGSL
jgi:hypothetical protein